MLHAALWESPLQMMHVEVTKYNKRFGIVKMAAKGYVGPDLAVEAELTLAMGKAS
jgi:3-hydroxyacyl-[acyl-carrier-protein] dehydratase